MEIEFADRQLERRYEDPAEAQRAWGDVVARKFVQRVNQLRAARHQREAYASPALRTPEMTGDRSGRWAMGDDAPWIVEAGDHVRRRNGNHRGSFESL